MRSLRRCLEKGLIAMQNCVCVIFIRWVVGGGGERGEKREMARGCI